MLPGSLLLVTTTDQTQPAPNVHVRSLDTREIVHSFECRYLRSSSQYDRMLLGLMRNMDLDRFYVDDSEVPA